MGDVAATIENIVVDNILANGKILPQASKANQALLMFAGCCFFAGILLLVYAIYLWLFILVGQLLAVVCTGVVLLMLAAGCACGISVYRDRKIAKVRKEATEAIQIALVLIKEEFGEAVQNNPKTLLAVACLAGFVAGKKIL